MLGAEHAVRQPPGLRSLDDLRFARLDAAVARRGRGVPRRSCRPRCRRRSCVTKRPGRPTRRSTWRRWRSSTTGTCAASCRNPPELARTFAAIEDDPTVYGTMNGPSEFHVIGTLQGLDASSTGVAPDHRRRRC